jgi:putative ABC transport system permease protein
METFRQDLRFAIRSLVKRPSFTALVIITLALGIGSATAIFSIVDAILVRPLPFAEPDRLVVFNETPPGGGRMSLAWPNYLDLRGRATSFDTIAAYQRTAFTVIDRGSARRFNGRFVTAGFFEVLGVHPQLGRTFTADDDHVGAAPVAIVNDRFWMQELGSTADVIGRALRTSEGTFTIVGVLPREFEFAGADDIFGAIGRTAVPDGPLVSRGNHTNLFGIARLKTGVTVGQAQAELTHIAADLARAYPTTNSGNGAQVQRLRDRFVEDVEPTLMALMGAVGFLLLLACANVMNLLIARGAARQHELAIRTALGSSRWRLVRHLVAESLLLSCTGAALGVVVAFWIVYVLVAMAPPNTPRIDHVTINLTSLLFALATSVTCGLVCGAFPALYASGARSELLARASRTSAGVAPRRTRWILMAAEVALAVVLLSGCGLMIQTMWRLAAVDLGFRPDHLLTARVMLAGDAWTPTERRIGFYGRVLEAVRQIPGVTAAALTLSLPIEGSNWGSVFIVSGKPVPKTSELPAAAFIPASDGYFDAIGVRVLSGRGFEPRDGAGAPKVVVINQALARRMWPGENPVGQQLKQGFAETPNPWREVIGVVDDIKLQGADQDTPMQVFLPLAQEPSRNVAIVARTAVDPAAVGTTLEAALQTVEPELPVMRIMPMTSLMRAAVATRTLSALIFSLFAVLALVIAAVGLYGVVSYSVTERTREIGIRMALGAERHRILLLFTGQGLVVAVLGLAVGLAGAVSVSRWLRQLVFGIAPTDPITLASTAVVLLIVAALACFVPARRAATIDPLIALRLPTE